MLTKMCKKCCQEKDTIVFSKDRSKKDGFTAYCKECKSKELKAFRATQIGKSSFREKYLFSKYGLTQEVYNQMRHAQDYRCMICKLHESVVCKGASSVDNTALHVDHCHTTGEVRGLLCTNCNVLLGKAKDNIDLLKTAIEYLERKMI